MNGRLLCWMTISGGRIEVEVPGAKATMDARTVSGEAWISEFNLVARFPEGHSTGGSSPPWVCIQHPELLPLVLGDDGALMTSQDEEDPRALWLQFEGEPGVYRAIVVPGNPPRPTKGRKLRP